VGREFFLRRVFSLLLALQIIWLTNKKAGIEHSLSLPYHSCLNFALDASMSKSEKDQNFSRHATTSRISHAINDCLLTTAWIHTSEALPAMRWKASIYDWSTLAIRKPVNWHRATAHFSTGPPWLCRPLRTLVDSAPCDALPLFLAPQTPPLFLYHSQNSRVKNGLSILLIALRLYLI